MDRLFREGESERDKEQVSLLATAGDAGCTSVPELWSSSEPLDDDTAASRRATRQRREALHRWAKERGYATVAVQPPEDPPALASHTEPSEDESTDTVEEPPTKRMKTKSMRKKARKRAAMDRRSKVAKLMNNFAPPPAALTTFLPLLINVGEILPAIAAARPRSVDSNNQ